MIHQLILDFLNNEKCQLEVIPPNYFGDNSNIHWQVEIVKYNLDDFNKVDDDLLDGGTILFSGFGTTIENAFLNLLNDLQSDELNKL